MTDFKFYSDSFDAGEQNEEDEGWGTPGRDSVIIAVDCCKEMFQVFAENDENGADDDDDVSAFAKICEGMKDMLRNKIICSDKDLQGLVLFGTRETKNEEDFQHIYVVQDLNTPSASRIEELEGLQEIKEKHFEGKFGRCSDHQIAEVLWCSSGMFNRARSTLATKTLVVFTWNDDPHKNDKNAHLRARTKAKDLIEQDTDIQVLSFNKDFRYDKFYKDIMTDTEDEPPFAKNPIDGIKNLYDFLLRKCTKQRPLGKILFQLCDGVEMSIGVYAAALRAKKGANVNIDKKSNQQVVTKTNYVEATTGEILMPADIKFLQKWGEKNIVFDKDERDDLRRFSGTGLKLLGFKPREKAIKVWHHVRQAQFIYPNDKVVKGSSTLFSALLTKCLDRDVVPVCSLIARSNSTPRLVALLPQQEEIDEGTGEQLVSPGFFVIFLPFSEDLRNVEMPENEPPSEDQVKAAESIIKRLKFGYHPSNFDNPALQTHYRNLEAMALDRDQPEEVTDLTLPDKSRIDKKAGNEIQAFKGLVFAEGYDPTAKMKPVKRKSENGARGPSKKPAVTEIDMKEYAMMGKLGKLTVPVLKDFCKNNGINLPTPAKKAEVIEAIEKHYV